MAPECRTSPQITDTPAASSLPLHTHHRSSQSRPSRVRRCTPFLPLAAAALCCLLGIERTRAVSSSYNTYKLECILPGDSSSGAWRHYADLELVRSPVTGVVLEGSATVADPPLPLEHLQQTQHAGRLWLSFRLTPNDAKDESIMASTALDRLDLKGSVGVLSLHLTDKGSPIAMSFSSKREFGYDLLEKLEIAVETPTEADTPHILTAPRPPEGGGKEDGKEQKEPSFFQKYWWLLLGAALILSLLQQPEEGQAGAGKGQPNAALLHA
ncbi:unnamed protein product [Vitrella brassicaformis CCMP3155]|uniref:ER membrane protein complex subunit 10 n=1 Tax=Vitrella brassicaformis (strain CCMP3155) TaxID=1169540 RepID=A0A0G4FK11_VITBC|nr:unnamed protein product [Vitrella brassicaformis CCMP3155]|eukprot:CEM13726.1 unnamed protein product [Vitrella brassicaformis CCMP3155]